MPDIGDVYDWTEIDARSASRASAPGRRTRRGTGAVVLAAALWVIDDVVLGDKQREPMVEEAEVPGPDPSARVVVHLVRGEPSASYALVRWPLPAVLALLWGEGHFGAALEMTDHCGVIHG